ncbi:transcription elongation factor GreAB [Acinetobacter sp. ANC 4635]|nr:transcription elongation factor GreAB [Acinetobacter sp. ANC 4635]
MDRKLLTAEGYQRLQDELNYLLRQERPEITKIVSWAASLGDRSENADNYK